jgi:hypothetical protein
MKSDKIMTEKRMLVFEQKVLDENRFEKTWVLADN